MTVVNPSTGALIATIPGFDRAHGVAFVDELGKAFAPSGGDSAVRVIDLTTLKVTARLHTAVDHDRTIHDPGSRYVFSMNGDAGSTPMIDPRTNTDVANIAPTGLAIDAEHHRLFSGCRSGVMAISDAQAGKLVTTVPIGQGVDATRFDPATQLAFASCGDGTITVIHEDSPETYTVVQTVKTMEGARTMELDQATHALYTASAKFGPRPSGRGRPPVLPNSFTLITLTR